MTNGKPPSRPLLPPPQGTRGFFANYFWFLLKNVIGWTLILLAFVTGPLIPGPNGILFFMIGFALVTFPGKRRLTSRAMRAMPKIRRKIRPWLRHHGIRLLPPRYHLHIHPDGRCERHHRHEEIIELHQRHHERLRSLWKRIRAWW